MIKNFYVYIIKFVMVSQRPNRRISIIMSFFIQFFFHFSSLILLCVTFECDCFSYFDYGTCGTILYVQSF